MIEGRAYCDKCASLLPSRNSRKELEGLLLLGVAVRAGTSAWEGTRLCRTRTAWTRWREWRYHEGSGLDPAQWWYKAMLYTVGRVCTEEQWQEWWEGEATRRDALTEILQGPEPDHGLRRPGLASVSAPVGEVDRGRSGAGARHDGGSSGGKGAAARGTGSQGPDEARGGGGAPGGQGPASPGA